MVFRYLAAEILIDQIFFAKRRIHSIKLEAVEVCVDNPSIWNQIEVEIPLYIQAFLEKKITFCYRFGHFFETINFVCPDY